MRHPFHFGTFIGQPVRRHATIHRRQRFAGGGVTDFAGNLDVGNSVAPPQGDIKGPHCVARDLLADGVAPPPQRLRQGKFVGVFSDRVAVVRKKPWRFWIPLFLPYFVGFQPGGQTIMDLHEWIY